MIIQKTFYPQNNFSFLLKIYDNFIYSSGIIKFICTSGIDAYDIHIKENAVFDSQNNFISSLDLYKPNYFSGNFNEGDFQCYYYSSEDINYKKNIHDVNTVSNILISGIYFQGFQKNNIVNNDLSQPELDIFQNNKLNYTIEINDGQNVGNDLNVVFSNKNDSLGAIKINNIKYEDLDIGYYSIDPDLNFPQYVYPGENFSFNLISKYNLQFITNIYLTLETDAGILQYEKPISATSSVATGFQTSFENNIFVSSANDYIAWDLSVDNSINLSNFSITGNIYFEIYDNTNQEIIWYKNQNNNSFIFGIGSGPYVKNNFYDYWSGQVISNQNLALSISGSEKYGKESFGNIEILKDFSWTDKWQDSLILNQTNSAGILFETTGIAINNINLYLYSKNNTSGLLNYYINKVFYTGSSNGYKNIFSGLGWHTGSLSNCCGTSGFPYEFPSGFPFSGQSIYGFFSGFGFGKLSGFLLTGEPIHSGNINISGKKLTPDDPNYFAPISENHKIKIDTNYMLSSGIYALIFDSVPNTSVQNETGIFWPKMWPNNVIPPNNFTLVVPENPDYFYASGYENSGYAYFGSGINFIKTIVSNTNKFTYTGIDYNSALSLNSLNNYSNLLNLSYYNNSNIFHFNILRFLNREELLYNDFYDECVYKISGNNIFKTGKLFANKNTNRQLQGDII
jgi:hypothetical protein